MDSMKDHIFSEFQTMKNEVSSARASIASLETFVKAEFANLQNPYGNGGMYGEDPIGGYSARMPQPGRQGMGHDQWPSPRDEEGRQVWNGTYMFSITIPFVVSNYSMLATSEVFHMSNWSWVDHVFLTFFQGFFSTDKGCAATGSQTPDYVSELTGARDKSIVNPPVASSVLGGEEPDENVNDVSTKLVVSPLHTSSAPGDGVQKGPPTFSPAENTHVVQESTAVTSVVSDIHTEAPPVSNFESSTSQAEIAVSDVLQAPPTSSPAENTNVVEAPSSADMMVNQFDDLAKGTTGSPTCDTTKIVPHIVSTSAQESTIPQVAYESTIEPMDNVERSIEGTEAEVVPKPKKSGRLQNSTTTIQPDGFLRYSKRSRQSPDRYTPSEGGRKPEQAKRTRLNAKAQVECPRQPTAVSETTGFVGGFTPLLPPNPTRRIAFLKAMEHAKNQQPSERDSFQTDTLMSFFDCTKVASEKAVDHVLEYIRKRRDGCSAVVTLMLLEMHAVGKSMNSPHFSEEQVKTAAENYAIEALQLYQPGKLPRAE
ncbi:unnamed protein product [Eruca vesicaria subsp. sativa]|uniref:Uncharacterized protein n=1 Tax=Eruca vesicaria subsp. sativa TaxID=29727 RepID=A0ABC8J1B4_ERUVS|nr:unnamed protein product [Eruca vesicaria subsp. sativa]